MFKTKTLVRSSFMAVFILLLTAAMVSAQTRPTIQAVDQNVIDSIVTIARTSSDGPTWIVVQADEDGAPGELLGAESFDGGLGATIEVSIAPYQPASGDVLHVTLYENDGSGAFDIATGTAVELNGEPVTDDFTVLESGISLVNVFAENDLKTLAITAADAGLSGELAEGGPYTLFAPTEAAWAATTLPADVDSATLLSSMAVPGVFPSSEITVSQVLTSVAGTPLDVQVADDGSITVNGIAVSQPDLVAYNGVIHLIDGVILPPAPDAAEEDAVAEDAEEVAAEETVTATEAVTDTAVMTETAAVTTTEVVTSTEVTTDTEVAASEAVTTETSTESAEAAATEEPTEEVATEEVATEEPATEAVSTEEAASEEVAADEVATDEAVSEDAAPEELPATGAPASPMMPLMAAGVVLVILALFAIVFRRRAA